MQGHQQVRCCWWIQSHFFQVLLGWFCRLRWWRPRPNGRHFADGMFKCIFLNENVWIPIEISLKCVPKGSINNNPALFKIMAWRHPGDKPLSETMMVSSQTNICVTRPQWVNSAWLIRHSIRRPRSVSILATVMGCCPTAPGKVCFKCMIYTCYMALCCFFVPAINCHRMQRMFILHNTCTTHHPCNASSNGYSACILNICEQFIDLFVFTDNHTFSTTVELNLKFISRNRFTHWLLMPPMLRWDGHHRLKSVHGVSSARHLVTVGYHIAFYGANFRHQLIVLTSPAAKWIPDRHTNRIRAENSLGKGN